VHRYDIRDVWMSLKLSSENFFILIALIWLVGPFVFLPLMLGLAQGITLINEVTANSIIENREGLLMLGITLTGIIFIQSIIIYLANRRYVIDLETGLVTFPRSDMENSIFAVILLFPYWNLMRTMTVKSSEIENIYVDTKRWSTKHQKLIGTTASGKSKYRTETKKHIRYTINITGTFGSANLQFLERQKRDEVRNAIQQCVKEHTGKNIDRKVAEFS